MKGGPRFRGRCAIQQRVLPAYRAGFFDGLARRCVEGLDVFAGEPRPEESIRTASALQTARWTRAENLHLARGGLYLCYQKGLIEWLVRADPSVLVVEANPRYLATRAAVAWMRERRRPVIGWGLGAPSPRAASTWLRRRFLRGLTGVVAYSVRGAAEYAAAGVPLDRIFVAPNAVEPPAVRMPKRSAPTRRPARLIFVGRLQWRKGIEPLLRACAAAPHSVELQIVGDGPERRRLERVAAEVFPGAEFTGAVYGTELRRLLDRADLFVLPGTGGLALQQALARGLPAIAARGDGSQEDMVTPRNGWLVPPEDPRALASVLAEALEARRRWPAMGRASLELARHRFHPGMMIEVFVRALRHVTEAAR